MILLFYEKQTVYCLKQCVLEKINKAYLRVNNGYIKTERMYVYNREGYKHVLTFILLMWTFGRAPNNASK
jgi:hypothetical protein